jgi:hypothetical protein
MFLAGSEPPGGELVVIVASQRKAA